MPDWRRISIGGCGAKPAFEPDKENMMLSAPYEVNLGGVYLPPMLVAGGLGLLLSYCLTRALTRYRLSRYFAAPPLVFLALVVILSGVMESLLFIR